MMKSLGASSGLLIALLAVARPVDAEGGNLYLGTLVGAESYVINLDNSQATANKSILTIRYLSGGMPAAKTKFEIIAVPPGARPQIAQTIPKGTRLVAIEISSPRGARIPIEIVQGNTSIPEACTDGCTLVLDVE